jgi:hypothetical protein
MYPKFVVRLNIGAGAGVSGCEPLGKFRELLHGCEDSAAQPPRQERPNEQTPGRTAKITLPLEPLGMRAEVDMEFPFDSRPAWERQTDNDKERQPVDENQRPDVELNRDFITSSKLFPADVAGRSGVTP